MQINMRKVLAMLSVMAMLCTLLPLGALVSAATVVVSYDFEDGTTAWGGTVIDDNGGKAIQWDASGYGYLNRKPTLQANTWYKVTFDHKGDSVNALIWDGTKAVAIKQPAASADWTTQSYVFYSGEYTSLNFRFQNPSSSAKTIYLDNIKLETYDGTVDYDGYLYDGNMEANQGSWVNMNGSSTIVSDPTGAGQGNVMQTNATASGNMFKQRFYMDAETDYVLSFKVYSYYTTATNNVFWVIFNNKVTYDFANIQHSGLAGVVEYNAYTVRCNVNSNNGKWIDVSIPFSSNTATATDITLYNYRTVGQYYFDDFKVTKAGEEPSEPETPEVTITPDEEADGNLVANGYFNDGTATGWTVAYGGVEALNGDYALKITSTDKYATAAEQTINVEANTDYTLDINAIVGGNATSGQARVHVYAGSTGTTRLVSDYYWNVTSSAWTAKQHSFNSGSNTQVRIVIQQSVTDGNVYYDDFNLQKAQSGYTGLYPETMTSGANIRFMTYNVLVGQDTANGGYSWGSAITGRPEKACAMINYYKPDVIALEEFSGEWYDYFVANMPDYAFGEMTSADSQNNGKLYTCIAYNVNTINLLDTDLMRMTKSRWGTQGMRYLNVAFLEVIATGEKFIACATHPDAGALEGTQDLNGDGTAAEGDGYWRQFQLEEAAEYAANLSATHMQPVIIGGDFNSGLHSGNTDATSYNKFVDAGFTDATAGRYIDHIFYNGMATHLYETTVADAAVNGASDHNAVFADIQFLDEYATPINNAKDYIKTQGRNTLKDGALWLDFSASGIEFSANCEGKVALNLNVKSIKENDATYGGLYFTVIVDGVKVDRAQCHITSTGDVELVLAENLTPGNHTFEVYRQTEHRGAEVGISSITMNGSFNAKPADNRLYIEFIGDSISTGFGALGSASNSEHNDNGGKPLFQDATAAYPYLTAKALGADFSDVCYSGIGAKYGWQDPNMLNFYPYQRWQYDRTTQYNFNARQPDVVVIALGTNDIAMEAQQGITVEQRLAGYQELLDLVRAKNPNSKIVWIYGMMKDDDNARIPAIIEENGGAAEGLYSLELVTNTAGAGWHPSAAAQQKFADDLVAFLNSDVLVKYVGDVETDKYDVIDLNGTSRMEMDGDKLGLAFRFKINANGIEVINNTEAVLDNATIDAFDDGNSYKLLSMGAIVSNDPSYGLAGMTKEMVDGRKVLDVNATYLCDLEADSAQYAVRITNIPLANEDTIIYARAYYTFEYEGRVITVYDDLQQANYIDKYDSNDGVLEW